MGTDQQEMEIGVAGPILNQKTFQRLYETTISIPPRWKKNIVAINYIYGARAFFSVSLITKNLDMSNVKYE